MSFTRYLSFLALTVFAPALAQTLPKEVSDALAAAPTVDTVYVQPGVAYKAASNVLKVRRLTITPNSQLVFPEQASRDSPFYILAVTKLTVPEPSPTEQSGAIVYTRTPAIKMAVSCGPKPNGANGTTGHDDGFDGGNGAPAANAVPRQAAKVYVIVGDLVTSAGNPKAPRLINLNFDGLAGDSGSDGCPGGDGGAGTDRGSFNGPGDAGKAGTGSRGGDAAPGQPGAQFSWFITPNVEPEVGRLLVSVEGGDAGYPGNGGPCGAVGRAGSGNWTGGGGSAKGKDCVGPNPAPQGAQAQAGPRGTIATNVGNYLSALPYDATVRIKRPRGRPRPAPTVPPPPPPE